MSAPFNDATNDAVQFLTKHGDLTRAAAYDAIRLLTGNGFVVTQTNMLPSATDLSQAAVAIALEAAKDALNKMPRREERLGGQRTQYIQLHEAVETISAIIGNAQHDALAAHVAAEVAKARAEDAATVLRYRPTGENAKHFVDVLVCDIANEILTGKKAK